LHGRALRNLLPSAALPFSLFAGVYDGHGGARCATFLLHNLHLRVFEEFGKQMPSSDDQIKQVLRQVFLSIDKEYLDRASEVGWNDGSCCCIVFVWRAQIVAAYVGDSDIAWYRLKPQPLLHMLTTHHDGSSMSEAARIVRNGGAVEHWDLAGPRVVSSPGSFVGLAVSRAFGDISFKRPRTVMTAEPDVRFHPLDPYKEQYLFLASDGFWDTAKPSALLKMLTDMELQGLDHTEKLSKLMKYARPKTNDDVTLLLISLYDSGRVVADKHRRSSDSLRSSSESDSESKRSKKRARSASPTARSTKSPK